jgi:hypothetical protein
MTGEKMLDQDSGTDRILTEHLARATGAVALAAVAIIHLIDLPGTLTETPLIGYGYLALIAATLLGAFLLITVPDLRVWLLVDLIACGALLAYVLSRTSGLPTDRFDIGNWNCALGIAAISTETLIVLLAGWRLQQPPRLLRATAQSDSDSEDAFLGASAEFTD